MNDREQARAELIPECDCSPEYKERGIALGYPFHQPEGCSQTWTEDVLDTLWRKPADLVLRALGMEQVHWWAYETTEGRGTWVEPPTDQGENDG